MIAHADPLTHFGLALAGVGIVAFRLRSWRREQPSPIWTVWAFAAGVTVVLVALGPPVEAAADRSFTGHMSQHLLLMLVAAPLLVVGSARRRSRHPRLPTPELRRRLRSSAPLVAVAAFVGVLVLTHLTDLYDLALRHRLVHDLEHVADLGAAVLVWAVIARGRRAAAPMRAAVVFAVIAATALVGAVMSTAPTPLVATYAARLGPAEAIADQQRAAALMWVGGMLVTLPLLVLAVWRWAADEQRRTERAEELRDAISATPPSPASTSSSRDVARVRLEDRSRRRVPHR